MFWLYNANCLVRNGFPVNIFFSTLAMEGAPFVVALSRAIDRPVLLLALFGAVSPLLAPATEIDGRVIDLVAETTVHDKVLLMEKVRLTGQVSGIMQV